MPPKSYIVVGAGWFGIRAVRALERHCPNAEVTVLELGSKDYIDINMQTPRMMSDPAFADRVYAPLSKTWKKARLVNIEELREVSAGSVRVVESGGEERTLEADGIVLATGAVHASPLIKDVAGLGKSERIEQLKRWNGAVSESRAGVLVVGGGATGVELAGDLACDFPEAKVTLMNRSELLLRGSKSRKKMHSLVLKQLEHLGVAVLNGYYVDGLTEDYVGEPKTYTTNKGVTVVADVVIMCVGAKPNVGYAPEEALDGETGGLVVDNSLLCTKLPGASDPAKPVWALGDCTQYGGRGIFADPQIAAFEASVRYFQARGTTDGGPAKYRHNPSESLPSLVSVGRKGGAATMPFVNKMLGAKFKGPDVALEFMYKKEFNVKV